MELHRLDFSVLLPADRTHRPELTGIGRNRHGEIETIDLAYPHVDSDDCALKLRVTPRRGWRIDANGAPHTIASGLADLGRDAVLDVLLDAVHGDPTQQQSMMEDALLQAANLGVQAPGPPWQLRPMPVGADVYALWTTAPDADHFAFIADCGDVVLTGSGLLPEPSSWRFVRVDPGDLQTT